MALESFEFPVLSTDKQYFFLEDIARESDGNKDLYNLFLDESYYNLGFDEDQRYPLVPSKLLTFNETETEE
jgi:hypothetical protein